MNSVRSCCVVSYNTKFERGEIKEKMHGKPWPDEPRRKTLDAKFVSSKQAEELEKSDGKAVLDLPDLPQQTEEPPKEQTIDELFRCTKTEPRLYYLPLTKEQTAQRQE